MRISECKQIALLALAMLVLGALVLVLAAGSGYLGTMPVIFAG